MAARHPALTTVSAAETTEKTKTYVLQWIIITFNSARRCPSRSPQGKVEVCLALDVQCVSTTFIFDILLGGVNPAPGMKLFTASATTMRLRISRIRHSLGFLHSSGCTVEAFVQNDACPQAKVLFVLVRASLCTILSCLIEAQVVPSFVQIAAPSTVMIKPISSL